MNRTLTTLVGAAALALSAGAASAQCIGFAYPRVCGSPGAYTVEGARYTAGMTPRQRLAADRAAVGITPQMARMIRPGRTVTCSPGPRSTVSCEVPR